MYKKNVARIINNQTLIDWSWQVYAQQQKKS